MNSSLDVLLLSMIAVLGLFSATQTQAAGLVTVCDEAHLRAAINGGGTVTFACSGTIELLNTIHVDFNLTVDGLGQDVTLVGRNGVFSVSCVFDNANACVSSPTVRISNLTISNSGTSVGTGGGFTETFPVGNTNANLTLSRVKFRFNVGGVVNNLTIHVVGTPLISAVLFVSECTFENNSSNIDAGAIRNSGDSFAYVFYSEFSLNAAPYGGAVFNSGTMAISSSTFANNGYVTSLGGHVENENGGSVAVANSTFSGARGAPGTGASIRSNSGVGSVVRLINSIVANPGQGSTPTGNCEGNIIDGGGNLQWPDSALSCVGIIADPLLDLLQNNGGQTPTMALLPGSPAIDGGITALCDLRDQRGVIRPALGGCDIGAFEAIALPEPSLALGLTGGGLLLLSFRRRDGFRANDGVD